jgi:type II secretory ATPase GspE/PulE/Tfp pilus assembly ATPase PilB-like protein
MDSHLRDMVGERTSAGRLRDEARRRGMTTLREAGLRLVRDVVTTADEVSRVIEWTDAEGEA